MSNTSTAMKTALQWVEFALALLVAFVVVHLLALFAVLAYQNVSVPLYHWIGVTEQRRSIIGCLILTLASAPIGLLSLKEWSAQKTSGGAICFNCCSSKRSF